jgi:hypothetical protein
MHLHYTVAQYSYWCCAFCMCSLYFDQFWPDDSSLLKCDTVFWVMNCLICGLLYCLILKVESTRILWKIGSNSPIKTSHPRRLVSSEYRRIWENMLMGWAVTGFQNVCTRIQGMMSQWLVFIISNVILLCFSIRWWWRQFSLP